MQKRPLLVTCVTWRTNQGSCSFGETPVSTEIVELQKTLFFFIILKKSSGKVFVESCCYQISIIISARTPCCFGHGVLYDWSGSSCNLITKWIRLQQFERLIETSLFSLSRLSCYFHSLPPIWGLLSSRQGLDLVREVCGDMGFSTIIHLLLYFHRLITPHLHCYTRAYGEDIRNLFGSKTSLDWRMLYSST